MNYLKTIWKDVEIRNNYFEVLPYEKELLSALRNLDELEKKLIQKKFHQLSWNIGTPRLFYLLKQSNVTSISKFIQELDNEETVQAILNDLLETELSLISDVILQSQQNQKLENHLQICLRKFIKDAIETPELFKINFMDHIKLHLSDSQQLTLHSQMIQYILDYKQETENFTIFDTIKNQKKWNEEFSDSKFRLIRETIKIICNSGDPLLQKLLEMVSRPNFENWKYYLHILRVFLEEELTDLSLEELNGFIKKLFTTFLKTSNEQKFYLMMVTVRQLTYFGSSHFGDYFKWYKNTIGSMVFNKLTKNEFLTVMGTLTNMVVYEGDPDIVKVHVNVAIPAPSLCSSYVIDFKQYSRTRLTILEMPSEDVDPIDLSSEEKSEVQAVENIVDLTMQNSEE